MPTRSASCAPISVMLAPKNAASMIWIIAENVLKLAISVRKSVPAWLQRRNGLIFVLVDNRYPVTFALRIEA